MMCTPGQTRIIVNADDFGRSEVVNDAVIRCLRDGLISSATIMANGESWEEACRATSAFPNASFGVHLNLTDYEPVSGTAGLESYLNSFGQFSGHFRHGARSRDAVRVSEEWSAQVQRIMDAGVRVSHLDSHHHSHTVPGAFRALKIVQRRFCVRCVRLTRNLIPASGQRLQRGLKLAGKLLWNTSLRLVPPGTTTVDYFGSVTDLHEVLRSRGRIRSGATIELMCHPGLVSKVYEHEISLLREQALDDLGLSWRLISYHDL